MSRLTQYVAKLARVGATDLLLGGGRPPQYWSAHGLLPLPGEAALAGEDLQLLLETWLGRDRWARLLSERTLSCVASLDPNTRVRVRCTWADHGATAQLRTLAAPSTLAELQLPEQLGKLAELERGLVIVTGPKCSGKTSLIAALLQLIASNRVCHIVTLESPVELLHESRGSSISQREVPRHCASYASGIRSALAGDADVIALAAADDAETFELACRAAASALVWVELPGSGAVATLDRCVQLTAANPGADDLPEVWRATVALELLPRRGGGRVPAAEILLESPSLRAALRSARPGALRNLSVTDYGPGSQTKSEAIEALKARSLIDVPGSSSSAPAAN
jgi:twitching motility protein PilT